MPPNETEVKNQIVNNRNALIPSNVPCPIIQQWLATATHTATQAHINKLNTIVNTTTVRPGITTTTVASLQNINSAYSPVVNLDYFPVTISQLPEINGQTVTPDEFLTHIRTNINDFINNYYAEFEPYNWYGIDESALWNSSNPSGAVIAIDFGYTLNGNGSYTFYVRGVSRLTGIDINIMQKLGDFFSLPTPFGSPDPLWRSFQDKISEFVNNNQGSASAGSK